MFRQLAQTRHQEPHIDPGLWERTANIWAGNVARSRANLMQLAATFYGKCASVAVMVVLVLGLQLLPAPTKPIPQDDGDTAAPLQAKSTTQQAVASVDTSRADSAATTSGSTSAANREHAPAAPIQTPVEVAATQPKPTPTTPTTPAPAPTQPDNNDGSSSSDLVSVSVLANDEQPLVAVSLPGISVRVL